MGIIYRNHLHSLLPKGMDLLPYPKVNQRLWTYPGLSPRFWGTKGYRNQRQDSLIVQGFGMLSHPRVNLPLFHIKEICEQDLTV